MLQLLHFEEAQGVVWGAQLEQRSARLPGRIGSSSAEKGIDSQRPQKNRDLDEGKRQLWAKRCGRDLREVRLRGQQRKFQSDS